MKWPGSMRCSPKPEIESWCPETATEFISRSFGRSLDGGLDVDFINLSPRRSPDGECRGNWSDANVV